MTEQKKSKTARAPEGLSTWRVRKKVSPLLNEWYGSGEGEAEGMKYLPETQHVSDVLARIAKKKLPEERVSIVLVQEHWKEIAGAMAARKTVPVRIDNHILYVEIAHPAYLAALNSKDLKAAILTKINQILGPNSCRGMVFIPPGGRIPEGFGIAGTPFR